MEKEITKDEAREMYNQQLEGVRLSIIASKIHVFGIMIQTAMLILIAIKVLK